MSDIDIIEQDGDEVLWRYAGLDGSSYVNDDGKAIDAVLCEGDFLLTPRADRRIKRAVAEWVAEAPERAIAKAADEEANREADRIHNSWAEWGKDRGGLIKHVIPSVDAYPSDKAHDGLCVLIDYPDWSEGKAFVSGILQSPSWGTVLRAFDLAVQTTKDFHHRFLEGLYEAEPEEHPEGYTPPASVTVLRFSTGS